MESNTLHLHIMAKDYCLEMTNDQYRIVYAILLQSNVFNCRCFMRKAAFFLCEKDYFLILSKEVFISKLQY